MRILAIEDDPDSFALTREHLAMADHVVIHAPSFRRGNELLEEGTFDAILLDLMLTNGTPATLLSHIPRLSKLAPVLILTGWLDRGFAFDAQREGASAYIVKGSEDATTGLARRVAAAREKFLRDAQHDEGIGLLREAKEHLAGQGD